jgi:hypothetical protein
MESRFCLSSITSITPSVTAPYPKNKGLVIDVTDVTDVFQPSGFCPARSASLPFYLPLYLPFLLPKLQLCSELDTGQIRLIVVAE